MKNYKVQFHYDNPLFDIMADTKLKNAINSEYVRLRNIACDELNLHYEEWNKEFGPEETEDSEYFDFIRSKQEPILSEINKREATVVQLYSRDECDIGGVVVDVFGGGNTLTNIYLTIKPVD